ncbi:MAG: Von Willebrand factor type A domain protein [uncultured Aureispira sp.]|uniref:von Willebrand factor type A domain protein n=1 Tax=uncultured Aureispira sp. TaxID=1331704 RepID=A0A6S6S2B4_9BACT|nr:MAG: Von Willebrand factor type A domain protein [uncultured Aureispira sp.]
MYKYFILSLLFFSLITISNGQVTGNLQGKVIDTESNEGLPFATVRLKIVDSLCLSTQTDFDGNYSFSNVVATTYDVEASYVGFPTMKIEGVLVKTGQVRRLDIEMSEGVGLETPLELVVVADRIPLVEQDAMSGGQTLGAEDIKNLATRSISSIAATTAGVMQADEGEALSSNGSRRHTSNLTMVDGSKSKRSRSLKRKKSLNRPTLKPSTSSVVATQDKTKATAAANGLNSVEKPSNEEYGTFVENKYIAVQDEALSTFSIDVDRASYSNIRRHLDQMQKPPKDAVRIEEMINYFNYDYPQPADEHPFLVKTEVSDCPWNKDAKLVHIGLQGKKIDLEKAPISNLVFLIDVSGSMSAANKLPLLKESLKLLINNMRAKDKMAMVVYAGAAGLIQASTSDKNKLLAALDQLEAGGSTAGGAGIELAYKVAKQNLVSNGNNRVIIATDGDFNVGNSSTTALETLIVEKRKDDIFLTVLGYGMGNYKDDRMEVLADKGNGNYAYIDNIKEAKKTLVKEMGGTLYTIAKDVKLQIEFNPVQVQSYRLVGYENRLLNKEDFNDDTKDAGELGAGHTVTALYEVILSDNYKKHTKETKGNNVDDLVYQKSKATYLAQTSKDLMTIKLRYKQPKGNKSILMALPVVKDIQPISEASENFRFASAVAGFGMLLRESEFTTDLTYDTVLELAKGAQGTDKEGYRKEFIGMVKNVRSMSAQANKIEAGK